MADQEDAAQKPDHLDNALDDREIADDTRAMQSAADDRRRSLIQHRGRNRAEETHRWISRDAGPPELTVRQSGRALGRLDLSRLRLTMRGRDVVVFFNRHRRIVVLRILVVI